MNEFNKSTITEEGGGENNNLLSARMHDVEK
jgi:hypothetical protein